MIGLPYKKTYERALAMFDGKTGLTCFPVKTDFTRAWNGRATDRILTGNGRYMRRTTDETSVVSVATS